jgi:hypothetical protein
MSIAEILSKAKPEVKSANKWHRSKFRRKSRGNPHKKTSPDYEKKPRKIMLNYFGHDKWNPADQNTQEEKCGIFCLRHGLDLDCLLR